MSPILFLDIIRFFILLYMTHSSTGPNLKKIYRKAYFVREEADNSLLNTKAEQRGWTYGVCTARERGAGREGRGGGGEKD